MNKIDTDHGHEILTGDSLAYLKMLPDECVDLVFCSPPYEDARTYGIGFNQKGEGWVQWAMERYVECVRVSRGLVAWVIEGKTRKFQWTATPALLMADLHRRGIKLRKPPVFHRVGIPGSGGPDWLRNDYEFIVCASKGKLPWSDNTACGKPPVHSVGGPPSHRTSSGESGNRPRNRNERGFSVKSGEKLSFDKNPFRQVEIANPGNVIHCKAGGGHMGSNIAHENEAPFPESLAEFFVKSFCPPGGIVLDIFGGSGTTLAAAHLADRICWSVDIRESQSELTHRRYIEAVERKNAHSSQETVNEASAEGSEGTEVLHADAGGDPPAVRSDSCELGRTHREDAPHSEDSTCRSDAAPIASTDHFQLI